MKVCMGDLFGLSACPLDMYHALVSGAAVQHGEVVAWSALPGRVSDQRHNRVGYMYDVVMGPSGCFRGTLHF